MFGTGVELLDNASKTNPMLDIGTIPLSLNVE